MPGNIAVITPADMAAWPTPNYVNPYERTWIVPYACVLYAVSTLVVILRMWLRITKQAGAFGWDDFMMIWAWLAGTMFTTTTLLYGIDAHIGRHVWDVPLNSFEKIARIGWVAQFSFLVTGCFTKVSVLLFYRRLVEGTINKYWKWAVIGAVCFTCSYSLAFILALIFNCSPTEAYWKAFDPYYTHSYTCVDTKAINMLAGLLAIISDLYAIVLPTVLTSSLHMARRQKMALNALFAVALVVVAASAVRTYYLWELGVNTDITSMIFYSTVASQFELQVGILCASVPSLRVFFRKYFSGSMIKSFTRSKNSNGNSRAGAQTPSFVKRITGNGSSVEADDSSQKNFKDAEAHVTVEDEDDLHDTSPVSSQGPIKTPADYEAYNMQCLRSYRSSSDRRRMSREANDYTQACALPEHYGSSTTFGK